MAGIIAGPAKLCPASPSLHPDNSLFNAQRKPDLLGWRCYEQSGCLDGSVISAGFRVPSLARAQTIDLPTSKQLIEEIPGHPQRLNSLPISMAVSPDKRYVVTVNAGYGTFESKYDQSLAVLDTQTGTVADFPRLGRKLAAPNRRSIPAWPSAPMVGISMPAWAPSPIPPAKRRATPATG